MRGEKIKVITTAEGLHEILFAKINGLGISGVVIKFVEPEEASSQQLISLVGDP